MSVTGPVQAEDHRQDGRGRPNHEGNFREASEPEQLLLVRFLLLLAQMVLYRLQVEEDPSFRFTFPNSTKIPPPVMVRHAMRCHAMPCHAMPCHAVRGCARLCCAMPCHAMLCYAMRCFRDSLPPIISPPYPPPCLPGRVLLVLLHNLTLPPPYRPSRTYPSRILASPRTTCMRHYRTLCGHMGVVSYTRTSQMRHGDAHV